MKLKQFLQKHGEVGKKLYSRYGLDNAIHFLERSYLGVYKSKEQFAKHFYYKDLLKISKKMQCYLDYELMADDLFFSDFFFIQEEEIFHVFKRSVDVRSINVKGKQ